MNVRPLVRVLVTLVVVALVVGIGIAIYNAGVSAGLAASGEGLAVDGFGYAYGAPYINGPMGWGFGALFGILFWIFVIFLLMGLVRAAVGGRRGGPGHGGWGDRRDRIEELHRELHRREAGDTEQRPAGA